jgi:hypothetical protein
LSCLIDIVRERIPEIQAELTELEEALGIALMVMAAWTVARLLAVMLIEESLALRAQQPQQWPKCPVCGARLRSKGFRERVVQTLLGAVRWRRRIGRCPNGCKGSQIAPLDQALGLSAHQRTSEEVQWMGCLLAVFIPYETACCVLDKLTGIRLRASTLWSWVQEAGQRVMRELESELQALAKGQLPGAESLAEGLEKLPVVIGADGVMVPFRPLAGTPKGKTQWREVKVAILARLNERLTRQGQRVTSLCQRRLVAVLGTVDALIPRLRLEAERQQVHIAVQVVWLSDGGRGFWRVFKQCFQSIGATAILDFYHAAQNLYKGACAWLDGRTRDCRQWFANLRHQLRYGQEQQVVTGLAALIENQGLSESATKAITNLYHYLKNHQEHIHYEQFKTAGLPIGSGLVESACKWLIQQRFKGVGMRWSESGFDYLLHLRLAWVNQRFDSFFPELFHSPN